MPSRTLRGVFLRTISFSLVLIGLSACSSNRCLDMCQSYEMYLEECGYGWSTAFAAEGWTTLDDCYDAHWNADANAQETCDLVIAEGMDDGCF